MPIDQRDALSSGAGSGGSGGGGGGGGSAASRSLNSRQSSFRSVVGSLLFDAAGPGPPQPPPAEYQYNDLSPPEQQLGDDARDGCDLCDCRRDADSEASGRSSLVANSRRPPRRLI